MVQYGNGQVVTKEAKDKFTSLLRLYLKRDIDFRDIVFQNGSFSYKDEVKDIPVERVHELYDEKKDEEIGRLNVLLDKNKLLKPVYGIISQIRGEYGRAKKKMVAYKFFDEFLSRIGPKTLSDINLELEKTQYFGEVNVAVIGTGNQYNKINVTPVIFSEPLGTSDNPLDANRMYNKPLYTNRILEKLDSEVSGKGRDSGLTHLMELQVFGDTVLEKWF